MVERGRAVALDDIAGIAGIALIDELGLHLHPAWQRRIGPSLRAAFPAMQFIVTTHSPLVVAGCTADEVVRLGLREGHIVELPDPPSDPRSATATCTSPA